MYYLDETNGQDVNESEGIELIDNKLISDSRSFNLESLVTDEFRRFHQLHLCQGKLYSLMHNILYEVDLNQVTQVAKFPKDEITKGYARICVFGQQLLLTDDQLFFAFDPKQNELKEIELLAPNGSPIKEVENTGLLGFDGKTMLVQYYGKDKLTRLMEFKDGSLRATRLVDVTSGDGRIVYSAEGVVCFQKVEKDAFKDTLEIFDLTRDNIGPTYREVNENVAERLVIGRTCAVADDRALSQILGGDEEFDLYKQRLDKKLAEFSRSQSADSLKRNVHSLPRKIAVQDYQLFNPYQLKGKIICYDLKNMMAHIADSQTQVVTKTVKIYPNFHIGTNALPFMGYIDPLIAFDGRVFGYFEQNIFEVKLNQFELILHHEIASGFSRLCVIGGQLCTHDETQYLAVKLDKNQPQLIPLKQFNTCTEIGVYSFCEAVLVKETKGDGTAILDRITGKTLFMEKEIRAFGVSDGIYMGFLYGKVQIAVDLTTMEVHYLENIYTTPQLNTGSLNELGLRIFSKQVMLDIFGTQEAVDKFLERRDQMFKNYIFAMKNSAQMDLSARIYARNEFGIPVFPEFYERSYKDIFERSNLFIETLKEKVNRKFREFGFVHNNKYSQLQRQLMDRLNRFGMDPQHNFDREELIQILEGPIRELFGALDIQ